MLEKTGALNAESVIEEFEALTKDAARVQTETLKKILEENGSAEYLQKLGLNGRTDPEAFKACVPLVTHKDLEPYIQRIADGDSSPILTGKPVTTMSLSSGTTQGKPKIVPFNDELMETTVQIYQTSYAYRSRPFPTGKGKALQFIYSSIQFKTKGGLAVGSATTNVYNSARFKKTMKAINSECCSPDQVIFAPDINQSLYCHLLCGLIFSNDVTVVSSTFAHSIIHAFRTFEKLWQELCTDLRHGVLSTRITDPSIRMAMCKILKPNPELADWVMNKCSGLGNWYGLIQEVFPNCKYVYGIMTGSMEPYMKKLRHYAGDVPLITADYGSSEGWVAANVNPQLPPELATYAVLPHIGYFEFLPLGDGNAVAEPLSLTQVQVGQEYEVIVTNFGVSGLVSVLLSDCDKYTGLYRYRLGDVVMVAGFHNSTPELKFLRRSNLLLSINIDKSTEKDLQIAVEEAAKVLAEEKLEVVDFSSQVEVSKDPGHYAIYWEISGEASHEALQECCNCLDRSFSGPGYVSSREVRTIAPLELRVVARGTFHKVLEHYLALGSAVNQFKTPRCVGATNRMVSQILSNNVVKSYFSTAYE